MSNGDANKCKFVNNFVLSLLVYLVLISSAMVSFEFFPMSNELTNEFLLIDIFFENSKSSTIFCVFAAMCKKACGPLFGFSLLLLANT